MKVLVIEDSIANLEILTIILEAMGYEIVTAEDGANGYRIAIEIEPDLIITDYHLPGLNGIELVKKIRDTSNIQDTPVIAMTADIYAKHNLIKVGCDAYLEKPIRKGSLLRTINQVISTVP